MMTSLIWWAKCCHPYLWLQFPILISALNVWLSISIFKIKIDKLASQNQNSIFKIVLWVVNIKIQIQDSKVAYQDWYSTSTFASLLGNIQYQNQNRSRHQIQHQFQEYCQYQHQNQPISIILPTSDTIPLLWPLIKSLKVKATVKGKYVTWYICHVGALSKAEDILEWNMGLVLATARILFQRKISRCAALVISGFACNNCRFCP